MANPTDLKASPANVGKVQKIQKKSDISLKKNGMRKIEKPTSNKMKIDTKRKETPNSNKLENVSLHSSQNPTQLTELEKNVKKCFLDIQMSSSSELKLEVKNIQIHSAKEIEVPRTRRKVILIHIPFKIYDRHVKKIQGRLIMELEKKLEKHVVLLAKRTILSKNYSSKISKKNQLKKKSIIPISCQKNDKKLNTIRPRSRTLTHVYNSLIDDIIAPNDVAGKRLRFKSDGTSTLLKIILDSKDNLALQKDSSNLNLSSITQYDDKLDTYAAVYKHLTHQDVAFVFLSNASLNLSNTNPNSSNQTHHPNHPHFHII